MTVCIADDEAPARRQLREYVAAMPDLTFAGEAASGVAAVELVEQARPDVLLLDVEMPGGGGFDVLAELGRRGVPLPHVVFATAYDAHALAAFEVGAVDYLLKPYTWARFEVAVRRALARGEEAGQAAAQAGAATFATHLFVPHRGRTVPLPVRTLRWAEAADDYCRLHATSGLYLATWSLARLDACLDPAAFQRVHRSALVRRDAVQALGRDAGGLFLALDDGTHVRVGRTYAEAVRRWGTRP